MSICIDAHQHFWKYEPVKDAWITDDMSMIQRDFFPGDLAAELQANGIDACVAVQADQSLLETRFLLDLANEHTFIRGVVGWIDLKADDIERQLSEWSKFPKLKGFRHIVQAEKDPGFLLQEDFKRGIKALAKHHFTYDILVYHTQLKQVIPFVAQFPNQAFVLDHLGKPGIKDKEISVWKDEIAYLAQQQHVCCKLSGLVTEADWKNWKYDDLLPYLDVALQAFGPKRLMFGSDWPVSLLGGGYQQIKEIIERFIDPLTTAEKVAIMGENAIRFYNL
ncbi:amidohydrolase family protein [Chitinophaga caeni]|uniref:amidohydrolase family protein n=1 Tax=Chitinophaga caeni TaxID=2029983 RepID=UPI001E4AE637|nr:amidohydrolase family protein [Chitinophaga caeni]